MARPKQSESQNTRALALEQANVLLHARGFLGVSMDEIAKAIGVRKASLYHHFPDGKEQIILEIAMQIMQAFETRLLAALHGKTQTRERLVAIAHWRLAGPLGTERRVREAASHMSAASQQQIFQALMGQLITPIHQVFLEGVRTGELQNHNTHLVSTAFMSVISELGELGQAPASDAEVEDVVNLFLHGIGAR